MKPKNIACIAFILLAIAIPAGAIGAHMLKSKLSLACFNSFETAVKYHTYSAITLLAIAALSGGTRIYFTWSLALLLLGILLFAGGCYLAAFREIVPNIGITGGKMAPIGGIFLIFAYLIMGFQSYKHKLK